MLRYGPVDTLPDNFDAFIDEIASGVSRLYGAGAEAEYRQVARRGMSANIAHPDIQAFGATDRGDTVGLAIAIHRADAAEINLVHVLASHTEKQIEDRLIHEAVKHLRAKGAAGIACECVPAKGIDLDSGFRAEGFEIVPRMVMQADGAALANRCAHREDIVHLDPGNWREAAAAIADAYTDNPGARLHAEVQTPDRAWEYIARIASGNYGPVAPGMLCAAMDARRCVGVGLGCRVAPGAGFVLQLAVRRTHQRRGLGQALLTAMAKVFNQNGLSTVYLGVTKDNPAHHLYEALGFISVRDVNAYVWWRNE